MNRVIMTAALVFTTGIAGALEVNFRGMQLPNGMPEGWQEDTVHKSGIGLGLSIPETVDGGSVLTYNLYNASACATNIIFRTEPIENVDCDNVSASIVLYRKKNLVGGKIDHVFAVISTNNFETFETIGDPVDFQELGRVSDGWVTNKVSTYIEGLSDRGKDVRIGLMAVAAGSSHRLGYVGVLDVRFVASATPTEVGLVTTGEGGTYSKITTLAPGVTNAMVHTKVSGLPEGEINLTNVFAQISRDGVQSQLMVLSRIGGTEEYVSDVISPAFDAGEEVKVSVWTEYTAKSLTTLGDSSFSTIGETNFVVARENAYNAWATNVTKKGSVWINELVMDGTNTVFEFAGTLNRDMTTGWKIAVSNCNGTVETNLLTATLNFTTNLVNGVVGLDVRRFGADVIPLGTNTVMLLNSRDVCESMVTNVVNNGTSFAYGMVGVAPWHEEEGYDYDWTGAAEGVFRWQVNDLESSSIGNVNDHQGFKIYFSKIISIITKTDSGTRLPYAGISITATNAANNAESLVSTNVQTSADGSAEILFSGYSCNTNKISLMISASAFGWVAVEEAHDLKLAPEECNEFTNTMSRALAFDDCDSLKAHWGQTNAIKWVAETVNARKCLRITLYNAAVGTNSIMQCVNSLSAGGKKYANISLDFRNTNTANNDMNRYNELCIELGTNSTYSGTVLPVVVLSNKRWEYGNNKWYSYNGIVELPKGFEESELWIRLVSRTVNNSSHAFMDIDNLRIAFQDVAMPTNLVRSVETPVSGQSTAFDLHVLPQTTGTVADVSADLYLVLNGVTNVVPFAFTTNEVFTSETFTDMYTNAIPLVLEGDEVKEVRLNVSNEALEQALGKSLGLNRPFLKGDEVTYFAAVRYNSDNGATNETERFETRYFPDNSTITNIDGCAGWIVEGNYGVSTNLAAYTFSVTGDPISQFGVIDPTTEGVKFMLHAFSSNLISSLTVNISDGEGFNKDYTPFAGLDTNAQKRVTGEFDSARLDPNVKLTANTKYYVTLTATDPQGGTLTNSFDFTTLAAQATKAPAIIEQNLTTVAVGAGADYDVLVDDGNAEWTEYAIRVTTSNGEGKYVTTNGVVVWKTIAEWKQSPELLAKPMVDLAATNYFSFVTRSTGGDETVSENPVTSSCWFPMTTAISNNVQLSTNVVFDVEFFDPAQSNATAEVQYSIQGGAWSNVCGSFRVPLDELGIIDLVPESFTTNLSWNAWDAVGHQVGEYTYQLRARVWTEDNRSSEWALASGTLDFWLPTVTLTSETPDPFKASAAPLVVTVAFSEPVANFTVASLTVSNGTVRTVTASTGVENAYTATIDPTTDGPVSVLLEEGAVTDLTGNGNVASATLTRTYDTTAPTATLTSTTPNPFKAGVPFEVTIAFSEPVVNFTASSLTVNNGSVSSVSAVPGAENTYTATITPTTDGNVKVKVAANAVTDLAGNGNVVSDELSRTFDKISPTVALTSTTPDPFNAAAAPLVVTVTFSEPVVNFTAASLTVGNGTVGSVSGSGSTYTARITPSVANGNVTVQVGAGVVADAAGNPNTVSAVLTRRYDTTPPTVALTSTTPDPFNAATAPLVVTVTFSESVTNFTASSLTVGNGTVSSVSGSGSTYTARITPSVANGNVTVQVAAGVVADAAGNPNTVSATLTRRYDTTPPTVALTSTTPDPFNAAAAPLVVTVTFSEPVTNFTSASLTVGNGTVSSVSGSGATYTATINPSVNNGDVTVQVAAGKVADLAGNGNEASATLTRRYDTAQPTVTLTSTTPDPFNAAAAPLVVTVTFSESVTNFTASSLTVGNGTVSSVSGSGATYTATITPTVENGNVTVRVGAGVVGDAAGNPNTASDELVRRYDTTPPSVVLTSTTPNPFNETVAPLVVTATFSEPVTNFTQASLAVGNGTVSKVSGSGATYTVEINPTVAGEVTVELTGGKVADLAGNGNVASTRLTLVYDNTKPTVTLSSDSHSDFNTSSLIVTATFSEPVTNFTAASLTVGNGTVESVTGSGTTYTATIKPVQEGSITVKVEADKVADAAGNGNEASAPLTRTYDKTPPTVELTSEMPRHFNEAAAPLIVAVAFSEPVTNFTASSLTVGNGMVSSVSAPSGAENTYTATITPTNDGPVTVQVAAGVVADAAGNGNAVSAEEAWIYDTTAPTVVLTSATPERFNEDVTFTVTVTFSEPVTNFTAASLTVNNGTVSSVSAPSGVGNTYTATITPTDNGPVTVQIEANAVTDLAGNGNVASEELSCTFDKIPPTVTLASNTPDPFNEAASPMVVTVTFSEPVTNFTVSSLTVNNGTVSSVSALSGAENTYMATITPTTDGVVKVKVTANAVTDLAGNGNVVSEELSRTFDKISPTVTLASNTPNPFNEAALPMVVTVTFSEPVTNFTVSSLTVGNGTVGAVSGSGTTYTVSITPIEENPVTVQVGADVVADAAGNGNTVSDTLSRTFDKTPPAAPVISGQPAERTNVKHFSMTATSAGASTYRWTFNDGEPTTVNPLTGDAVERLNTVSVIAIDAAGNESTATSYSWWYDETKPTVTLASTTPDPFNEAASPMVVTVTFSEPVTNFTASSLSVNNGTVNTVSAPSGVGNTYTATITPTDNGIVTVQVAANAVTDLAGNGNVVSEELSRTYDKTPPTVTLTSEMPERFSTRPLVVTVAFSEAVTNFTVSSLAVSNGTVSSVAAVQGVANAYTVSISPAAEGAVTVQVEEGVVGDLAGNGNAASAQLVRTYDETAPTVTLASEMPGHFNEAGAPLVVAVAFSEAVTNFTASSLVVSNGTVSSVSASPDAENTYTATITPIDDGLVTVKVEAGVVADLAGNGNVASDMLVRTYDTTAPVVELSSELAGRFNASAVPLTVTVTFSEMVTNFTASSVTVSNAVVEATELELVDEVYVSTLTVTPTIEEGEVTLQIAGGAVADLAGNGNVASEVLTLVYDNEAPTVNLTSVTPNPFNGDALPLEVTVTFSEAVTNFVENWVTVSNGMVSSVSASVDADYTYTLEITPTVQEGEITIQVETNKVTDLAGNGNVASEVLALTYDNSKPTVTLTSDTLTPYPLNTNGTFMVTVTFSDPVTGFTSSSLTVANGTVGSVSPSEDGGCTYTATITPTAIGTASVTVQIAEGAVTDLAGNGNTASAVLTKPTVSLTSAAGDAITRYNAFSVSQLPLTVQFSAPVTNFTGDVVVLGNGLVSTVTGSGSTYTITITPSAEGELSVQIRENAAGNGNAASTVVTTYYDLTKPGKPVISGTPANGSTMNVKSFSLEANATENESYLAYYVWQVNGTSITVTGTNMLTDVNARAKGALRNGTNKVSVVVGDAALNTSPRSDEWIWVIEEGASSADVEFGGGICVKVDSETGATNEVRFTSVDFRPGEISTFTLSGFDVSSQEVTPLGMWFIVSDTPDGAKRHVPVSATLNAGSTSTNLTVTLPAAATENKGSLFIFGIDNKVQ